MEETDEILYSVAMYAEGEGNEKKENDPHLSTLPLPPWKFFPNPMLLCLFASYSFFKVQPRMFLWLLDHRLPEVVTLPGSALHLRPSISWHFRPCIRVIAPTRL